KAASHGPASGRPSVSGWNLGCSTRSSRISASAESSIVGPIGPKGPDVIVSTPGIPARHGGCYVENLDDRRRDRGGMRVGAPRIEPGNLVAARQRTRDRGQLVHGLPRA